MRHYKIKLKEQQYENFKTLANYLANISKKQEKFFDMKTFAFELKRDLFSSYVTFPFPYEVKECKTIGCALGHAPYAGIKPFKDESWEAYGQRCFYGENEYIYSWIFQGNWAPVDGTPQGAAKRINYMLEKGIPEDFYQFTSGNLPLPY